MNIHQGNVLIEGTEGQEFETVSAARDDAVQAAREMLAEKARLGEVVGNQRIDILDNAGTIVAVVPLLGELRLK